MDNPGSQLILHDRPYMLWGFGAAFFVTGLIILGAGGDSAFFGVIFGGVGAAIVALTPALTITANRSTRTLTLAYRSLLKRSDKVIPFADIAAIEVEMSMSSTRRGSRRRRTPTYRVTIRTRDGASIPLRDYYAGGLGPHQKLANQLRDFIGVGGVDMAVHATPQERRTQSYADIY